MKIMLKTYPCTSDLNQIGLDDDADRDTTDPFTKIPGKSSPKWPYSKPIRARQNTEKFSRNGSFLGILPLDSGVSILLV